jgi:hypothetical protein
MSEKMKKNEAEIKRLSDENYLLECLKNFKAADSFEIRPIVSGGSGSRIVVSKNNLFKIIKNESLKIIETKLERP